MPKPDRDGIYERNGWWWLRYRGQRISLKIRASEPKSSARREAERIKRAAGDPAYAAAVSKSLSDACAEWLAYVPTAGNRARPPSAATLQMYGWHLGHFVRILGADSPVSAVDAAAVDRYIATRRSERPWAHSPRTVSASTVAKELGTLGQILRLGLRRGWYHLPLERVLPEDYAPAYTPGTRHLTLPQVWALLGELEWRRAAVVAYIVATGADWGAVWRAEPDDLGTADHCSMLVLVRGTKNSERWNEVGIIGPLGPLAAVARGWLLAHGGFAPWRKENAYEALERACKRAGVPRVTARDLRRSHGKILAAHGVPPWLIGRQLRHTDSRMAELVYAVPERADVRRDAALAASRYKTGTR